eukprot:TRINITY_DN6005_c0_g1_i2.p1 TRINITY_DN6005_c0_g1~~TRINITY_DN6005_c0_g1_i2.p1  ORF type:complete len:450 (-),score=84.00 TRINITY_DN6005_c0_g1_i2:134-1483(-)
MVLCFFLMLMVAGSSTAVATQVTVDAQGERPVVLYGLGNELVFQSVNDTQLNTLVRQTYGSVARYPGGTPSDYWLWSIGWINRTSDRSGCSNLPVRSADPSEWALYAKAAGADAPLHTVFDLNQLQTNLSYQIEGLLAHQKAGTPIRYIELGNEMYDSTRPDVLARYPQPADYAAAMQSWVEGLRGAFPPASLRIAIIGCSYWEGQQGREAAWNSQVLTSPAAQMADAATIHVYIHLPDGYVNQTAVPGIMATAFGQLEMQRLHLQQSVPSHLGLWVTEFGTFGPTNPPDLQSTWVQGVFRVLFELLLPAIDRVEMVLPYCVVCGDPNQPAFQQPGPGQPYAPTPQGALESFVLSALRGGGGATTHNTTATTMAPLLFTPNPVLDPSVPTSRALVGWIARSSSSGNGTSSSVVVLNVLPTAQTALDFQQILYPSVGDNPLVVSRRPATF